MEHRHLCSYNLPQQINLIGPSCQELRITEDILQQEMSSTTPILEMILYVAFSSYLNNASIFELDQVRLRQNLSYQQSLDIVSQLSCENPVNFDLQQFKCELKKSKDSNDGFLRMENVKETNKNMSAL